MTTQNHAIVSHYLREEDMVIIIHKYTYMESGASVTTSFVNMQQVDYVAIILVY